MRAKAPTFITSPERTALMDDGAMEWASGNHVCSGNKAALMLKPTMKRANAARMVQELLQMLYTLGNLADKSAMFSVPVLM